MYYGLFSWFSKGFFMGIIFTWDLLTTPLNYV